MSDDDSSDENWVEPEEAIIPVCNVSILVNVYSFCIYDVFLLSQITSCNVVLI